jgi:tetratricopeptide (TPR) repeat protein
MNYGRAHYNHGQVLLALKRPVQAEQALLKALSLDPQSQDFFIALIDYYLKAEQPEKAKDLAIRISLEIPGHKSAIELLQYMGE